MMSASSRMLKLIGQYFREISGLLEQVQQLGGLAAAAVAGEEELGRSVERRQQGICQFRDRISRPVDVERIGLAVLPGLERQVQLEVEPGPIKIIRYDVVKAVHGFLWDGAARVDPALHYL